MEKVGLGEQRVSGIDSRMPGGSTMADARFLFVLKGTIERYEYARVASLFRMITN